MIKTLRKPRSFERTAIYLVCFGEYVNEATQVPRASIRFAVNYFVFRNIAEDSKE
jgi:hypothetical protein